MGLQDWFTAVQTQMTTVLTGLSAVVPTFRVGADQLNSEDTTPRIVFVPTLEQIQGPHAQGGDGTNVPRPLATRHCAVQCHIWGDDIPSVEALIDHLVAAIHAVSFGAHVETTGDWTLGQAAIARKGWVYVLEAVVLVPIKREPDVYGVVTAMPISQQVDH